MADQDNVKTTTIKIDTNDATQSVEDLSISMKDMSVIAGEAAKGVTHIGGEYQFASKKLQEWYDNLKKLHLEHNQTTVDLIDGMQKAAAATKVSATASEEHGKVVKKANEGVLSGLKEQKDVFENIGRLVEGKDFGISQIAKNFGLIGPAAAIATGAVIALADALWEEYKANDAATIAAAQYVAVMDKAAEGTADAILNVEKMDAIFDSVNKGFGDRKVALEEYNEKFGKVFGLAKDLNEAESTFHAKSGAYIESMSLRAQADAAYQLSKEENVKALKAQAEQETSTYQNAKALITSFFSGIAGGAQKLTEYVDDNVKEHKRLQESYVATAKSAKEFADLSDKLSGINTSPDGKKTKEKQEHDNSLEELKRYIAESQKISASAEEKEVISENIKYEKIKADLIKFHHSTEDLTEQHNKNLLAIEEKYNDLRSKLLADYRNKLDAANQKALDDFEKQALVFELKGEQAEKSKFQVQLDNATATYTKLKEMAMLFGQSTNELDISYANQKKKIQDDQEAQNRKDELKRQNDSIKANRDANKQIHDNDTLTFSQKLSLLKKDIDMYKEKYKTEGTLTLEDQARAHDDLEAYKKIQQEKMKVQQEAVAGIASGLESVSELVGKNTQAGKAFAIAAATIQAIQGAISAFTALAPIPIVGPALGVIAAAAALAAGYANIKKIEAVQVPGQSGGGTSSSLGGGGSAGAPNIPSKSLSTNLSQSSLTQMKNNSQAAPIKAVVVESDMTNSQARTASYRRGSSLN